MCCCCVSSSSYRDVGICRYRVSDKCATSCVMSFIHVSGDSGRNSSSFSGDTGRNSSSSSSSSVPRKKMRVGKSLVHEHFPRQEITDAEASSGVKVKIKCKYCQKTLYHANCEDLKLHLRREHYQAYLEVEKGDENALEERRKRLYAASDNATSKAEINESSISSCLDRV